MRIRVSLLVSVALAAAALAACEDSSSSGSPTGPSLDAGNLPDPDGGGSSSGGGDDGGGPIVSECEPPTGAPTVHDKPIRADETWAAGVHEVAFDVALHDGATLTLAPCAIVRVAGDHGLSVGSGNAGDGGAIVAHGTPTRRVLVEGRDAGKKWSGILVASNGLADLAYTTIRDGGSLPASRGGGGLHLLGDQYKPIQSLAKLDHVTIEGSGKYGLVLEGRGAVSADSHDLVITGSGSMPVRATAPAVGTIPPGVYTGNTVDAFRLLGSGAYEKIDADVTIHDRGVPYVVGGDGEFSSVSVEGPVGAAPVLTIEAGVVMKFSKTSESGLFVERASTTDPARGVLRVLGSAAKPVLFTSAEATPLPGDWLGIHFRGVPNAMDKIDFARIEYAGGDTGSRGFSCGTEPSPDKPSNEAAIAIFGPPASAFVTNTTIVASAANAIERAWTGDPIDFRPTNTFTGIMWCNQTYPRPLVGACPDPAPCDR